MVQFVLNIFHIEDYGCVRDFTKLTLESPYVKI